MALASNDLWLAYGENFWANNFNRKTMNDSLDEPSGNVRANLSKWDNDHKWELDGDEWSGQAAVCGVPYQVWKNSLIESLILPNIDSATHVMEIAPGHGRWSAHIIPICKFATLVDLSPNCLNFCKEKFREYKNVDYYLTTGMALPNDCDKQIDFIWSYDSFVHMAPDVIRAYLGEFQRVLRPNGLAIIHHANIKDLTTHAQEKALGWRSAVNADMIKDFAGEAQMEVSEQIMYWDHSKKIGCPRFGDMITILRKTA